MGQTGETESDICQCINPVPRAYLGANISFRVDLAQLRPADGVLVRSRRVWRHDC